MMAWFSIPSNETDPICTYYFEGTIERPKEYGTFSEFMKKDLMGNAKLTIENRRYKKLRRKWWQFRK
jgi:hypothetical protein